MSDHGAQQSYEGLRHSVEQLPPAAASDSRELLWADSEHVVAVSRDPRGALEVFVVGEELAATDRLVKEHLEHQEWWTATGDLLTANRIVLPNAPHFDAVATFICAELIQNGVQGDCEDAFRRTEPVISLALRRAALSSQVLLGLAGELYVIDALTREAHPHAVAEVVGAWAGSTPSSRDLQLRTVGIEVKTTTGRVSEHHVQGFHQLELGTSVDAEPETHLFLLSLGVDWLPDGSTGGISIPGLVDAVKGRFASDDEIASFLDRVKQYGGDAAVGYDHEKHRSLPRFRRKLQVRFERLYDMTDPSIRVLRTSDVEGLHHIDPASISFRVSLPPVVRGDLNPVAGMPSIARKVLGLVGLATS